MKILITGTPGTGKSAVAKELGRKLGWKVINEREFCLRKKIGKRENGELEVPIGKLGKELRKEFKKSKNLILEGHLLCETKLAADLAIVLHASVKELEERLWEKGYGELKILDNIFCEQTGYCSKKALKNYGKKQVLELENGKGIKEIAARILKEIGKTKAGKKALKE
ncbi:MAG: AAA family ATPase [Candidatus Diapherotrites archaeon]|nr:AAA family ATPase [Candidatus Diapherotrites archaeon]HIH33016.1 AAA family ATPase [Candidatus Diapherotrites archaeon]